MPQILTSQQRSFFYTEWWTWIFTNHCISYFLWRWVIHIFRVWQSSPAARNTDWSVLDRLWTRNQRQRGNGNDFLQILFLESRARVGGKKIWATSEERDSRCLRSLIFCPEHWRLWPKLLNKHRKYWKVLNSAFNCDFRLNFDMLKHVLLKRQESF